MTQTTFPKSQAIKTDKGLVIVGDSISFVRDDWYVEGDRLQQAILPEDTYHVWNTGLQKVLATIGFTLPNVPEAEGKIEWVRCSERFPDDSNDVFVKFDDELWGIAQFIDGNISTGVKGTHFFYKEQIKGLPKQNNLSWLSETYVIKQRLYTEEEMMYCFDAGFKVPEGKSVSYPDFKKYIQSIK